MAKFIRTFVIATGALSLGMLAVTPQLGYGGTEGSAYDSGYQDGARAGQQAARDTNPDYDENNQSGGAACCGGQQQQSSK